MSNEYTFGSLTSGQSVGGEPPSADSRFRIALLGDFSGRASRGEELAGEDLSGKKPRKVDREGLDAALAKFAPELTLEVEGAGELTLTFAALDDFHPDALHDRVGAFSDCYDAEEKRVLMNAIVHHPAFQALESTWRGLDWLLARAWLQGRVEFKLIDVTQAELASDLTATETLEETALYRILVDYPAERGDLDPWTILLGLYQFDPTGSDVDVLGRVAKIASKASSPFLTGVASEVLDAKFKLDDEALEAWDALRALPETQYLGLSLPRFLLRPPYGENTKTITAFEYEEFDGPASYLWGSAALACAELLARGFVENGWAFRAGAVLDLNNMAMHVTRDEDDEPQATMAEVFLSKSRTEPLVNLGMMPLLCVRNRDQAQFFGIHSLAKPASGQRVSPLVGRWNQKAAAGGAGVAKPAARGSVGINMMGGPTPTGGPNRSDDMTTMPTNAPGLLPGVMSTGGTINPLLASMVGDVNQNVDYTEKRGGDDDDSSDFGGGDDTDSDLAGLMGGDDADSTTDTDADSGGGGEEMDPELAALMAGLDSGGAPSAADDEMDPELAKLMADLDASGSQTPADDEMDPELAKLMADLDASGSESAADDEMDPELAKLMADLDASGTESAADDEMDPELAKLMKELEEGTS